MTYTTAEFSNPQIWAKWALGVLIMSAILALIPLFYDIAQERLTPRDYWFTYHAVEPTNKIYNIGDDLTFSSTRTVNKTAKFEWSDTLRCDTGTGDRTFSIYEAGKVLEPHDLDYGVWTYRAAVPDVPAECYLISTTTAKLRYTNKVQTLTSQRFEIK